MSDSRDVVLALGFAAMVGGGFRAMVVVWAMRRDEIRPREKAPKVLAAYACIAVAGLAAMLWIFLT